MRLHSSHHIAVPIQPLELLLKCDRTSTEVDLVPAKAQQLTHAKPSRKFDEHRCARRRVLEVVYERLSLIQVEPRLLFSFPTRRLYSLNGIYR